MSETSFDSKRRLCPEGSCIGVIGADGRCSECGRSADGKPRALAGGLEAGAAATDGDESEAPPAAAAAVEGDAGGFDPSRRLCQDGSCVGVIGPDGRCGVCGREAAV